MTASRPYLPSVVPAALAALTFFVSSSAMADLCFPPPTFVPGLYGPPAWQTGSQLRTDLNEPRWAASPLTGFPSDSSANNGVVRMMTDAGGTKLYVSMQTAYDPGIVSSQDKVFFGISETSGGSNDLARAVMIRLRTGAAAGGFVLSNQFTDYSYDANAVPPATTWTNVSTPPTWVIDAASWSNEPAGSSTRWGINFVVDLAALGITPTDTFRLAFGMAIRNETDGTDHWSYSPAAALPGGVVTPFGPSGNFLTTPTAWAAASAASAGCAGGITLDSSQIWTNNPVDSDIDLTDGHVNVFSAQPSFGSVPVAAGTVLGEFRIANWGTVADPNAGWLPIPGATGLSNAGTTGLIQFTCPANSGGQTCGMATPATKHQCVQVRLNHGLGYNQNNAPITTASAYRNMDFVPLSTDEREAEVSLAGLPATASGQRDVYLYVHAHNLPEHGQEQKSLPHKDMATTLRNFLAAPQPGVQVRNAREAGALLNDVKKKQVADARARGKQEQPGAGVPGKLPVPGVDKLPSLITDEQALRKVWPSYEVKPYYDSGTTSVEDKNTYKVLVPMPTFHMFFWHDGELYGFSHDLEMVSGGTLTEVRKPTKDVVGLYKLTMAASGVARLKTSVTAHETPPTKPPEPPVEQRCPVCEKAEADHGHCHCSMPGYGSGGDRAWLLALLALAGVLLRRWTSGRGRPA
jgi:hypothetical protein